MTDTTSIFNDYYRTQVADAFAEDLEVIRQEPGLSQRKVSTLIDCLESGVNIFDSIEQQLHVNELKRKKKK